MKIVLFFTGDAPRFFSNSLVFELYSFDIFDL